MVSDGQVRSTPEIIKTILGSDTIKPVLLPFPITVLRIIGRLFGRQQEIRRLTEDLEIDISHTCDTLNWQPPALNSNHSSAG